MNCRVMPGSLLTRSKLMGGYEPAVIMALWQTFKATFKNQIISDFYPHICWFCQTVIPSRKAMFIADSKTETNVGAYLIFGRQVIRNPDEIIGVPNYGSYWGDNRRELTRSDISRSICGKICRWHGRVNHAIRVIDCLNTIISRPTG